MLESIGHNTQGKGLDLRGCLLRSLPVDHHPRKLDDLGDPATVFLLLDLDFKAHSLLLLPHERYCTRQEPSAQAAVSIRGTMIRRLTITAPLWFHAALRRFQTTPLRVSGWPFLFVGLPVLMTEKGFTPHF